jgi:hypothetical protein
MTFPGAGRLFFIFSDNKVGICGTKSFFITENTVLQHISKIFMILFQFSAIFRYQARMSSPYCSFRCDLKGLSHQIKIAWTIMNMVQLVRTYLMFLVMLYIRMSSHTSGRMYNTVVWIKCMMWEVCRSPTLCRYLETILISNDINRVRWVVLGLSQDGVCNDSFGNLSENSLKGDQSNDTKFKPHLFSLVNTFKDHARSYLFLLMWSTAYLKAISSTLFASSNSPPATRKKADTW